MNKLVNLYSSVPITNLSIPRVGTMRGITLSVEDIRICLQSHARVEEIIGTKVIPLGFDNYDKDNGTEEVAPTPVVKPTPAPATTVTKASIIDAQKAAESAIADTNTDKPIETPKDDSAELKSTDSDASTNDKRNGKNKNKK